MPLNRFWGEFKIVKLHMWPWWALYADYLIVFNDIKTYCLISPYEVVMKNGGEKKTSIGQKHHGDLSLSFRKTTASQGGGFKVM